MSNTKVLVYKMTHEGDPNDDDQIWGETNCMGVVRTFGFDIVIGIGGHGYRPEKEGIAGRVVWVGRKPKRINSTWDQPVIHFEAMQYFGSSGPFLSELAPNLAQAMSKARFKMNFTKEVHKDVMRVLAHLADA